nr:hypothetical protein [Tanacetum cinerariifolium]
QTNSTHGLGYVSSEDDSASDRLPPSGGYHAVSPLITGTFMPPKPDLVFHTPPSDENEHLAFNTTKHVKPPRHSVQPIEAPIPATTLKPTSPKTSSSVLPKSKPVSVTVVRPVSAVVPKIMMTRPRHAHSLNTRSNSSFRRHMTHGQSPKTSNSPPRVTAAKAKVVPAAKTSNSPPRVTAAKAKVVPAAKVVTAAKAKVVFAAK